MGSNSLRICRRPSEKLSVCSGISFRPASGTCGAVISAEPGIYLPGKLGVRIEDVIILGEDGCEDITLAPKELIIL